MTELGNRARIGLVPPPAPRAHLPPAGPHNPPLKAGGRGPRGGGALHPPPRALSACAARVVEEGGGFRGRKGKMCVWMSKCTRNRANLIPTSKAPLARRRPLGGGVGARRPGGGERQGCGDRVRSGGLRAAAVLLAVVGVAIIVLGSGGSGNYEVNARFQNASQLVKGNLVQVSGKAVGKVSTIDLTDRRRGRGHDAHRRRTTRRCARAPRPPSARPRSRASPTATSTCASPHGAAKIPDGGVIDQDDTTTAVDLDQLFNTFDPKTRERAARRHPRLGDPVRRPRRAGQRGPALPQPLARRLEPPVLRSSTATRRCSSASSSPPPSS